MKKEDILKEELSYLEETKEVIKDNIRKNQIEIKEEKERIISSKRELYNIAYEMQKSDVFEKMHNEDLNVSLVNNVIRKNIHLTHALETPYFGRVDFNDGKKAEKIYVGLTSVEKDFKPYVYDWRAPISNLYYNYEKGKAHIDAPMGQIEGEITLKRQYQIIMGRLINMFETGIALEDEALQSILASSNTEKMKNIVSTIQKEQNEIIRYKGRNHLIVEGIAGSGKTAVALHRVAFLLYNQKNLTSKNVVIFSPNNIFTEYISNVLPELGEENTHMLTFDGLIKKYIKIDEVENLSEFIEKFYTKKLNDKYINEIKLKLSDSFKDKLDKYLKDYISKLSFTNDLGLKKKIIKKDELNKILNKKINKLSIYDCIEYTARTIANIFDIDEDKNTNKLIQVIKEMLNIKEEPINIYNNFLKSINLTKINDNKINYEDIIPILYLYFEIHGYPILSYIKQVVIDEAQDYTKSEFAFLKKIFKDSNFTILGDVNQTINPLYKYKSLDEIKGIFKDSNYIKLYKTYRSSPEIIEYSNNILGLENIKSIRISNNIKVITKKESNLYDNLREDIKYLKSLNIKTIGIITKTYKESKILKKLLYDGKFIDNITLKDVMILPCYLAKGLEFEGCILYTSIDNYYKEEEKNLYYVSATRARHALIVYNQNN